MKRHGSLKKTCKIWLKKAFPSTFFGKKSNSAGEFSNMLVWDACPVHRAEGIKKHLKQNVFITNLENLKLHGIF